MNVDDVVILTWFFHEIRLDTWIDNYLDLSAAILCSDDIIRTLEQNGWLLNKSAILFWRFH